MSNIINDWKSYWTSRQFLISVLMGVFVLGAGIVANYYAQIYTTLRESNSVTDLILDNIKTFDVDYIYIDGTFIFLAVVVFSLALNLKRVPFSIKAIGLFYLVRSFFTILTHIGQPGNQLPPDLLIMGNSFFFSGDLFFSGHAGFPFLMSLIFWDKKWWRITYILISIIFAVAVLLGHYHYSIDVFSAYFITYGIYNIALTFFSTDAELFSQKQ